MINHILDQIYIGDWQDAKHHNKEFAEIFTVAKDSPYICNHYYGLVDGPYPENERLLFMAINDLTTTRQSVNQLDQNKRILVHCVSGFSRSVSVVAGYMIEKYGYNTEYALSYIKDIRPLANPVYELFLLLKKYEKLKLAL